MSSRFSKGRRGLDLESELRTSRPEAPGHLVRSIAARLAPRPLYRRRTRIGMVGALAAASLAALGATGGLSYAASSIANAAHSVGTAVHLTSAPKFSARSTSAGSVYVAAPSISGISPSHGTINTKINVSGTNLARPTMVTLGGEPVHATATSTSISFSVPADATSGSKTISVTTAGGTATGGPFTVDAAPTVSHFAPAHTPVEPGTTIAITGTNLNDVTSVKFGTIAASVAASGPTSMTVITPTTIHAGTTYSVMLFSLASKIGITAGSVTAAPGPVVQSVVALTGVTGTVIKLTGQNFSEASDTVTIDGVTASHVNSGHETWSATNGYVSVPDLSHVSGVGLVTISDTIGSSSYSKPFVPTVPPLPTGGSPSVSGVPGVYGGGKNSTVTISGTHLWGVTVVNFQSSNSHPATGKPKVSADGTSLTVTVPANAADGTVSVTNPAGNAAAGSFQFISSPTITGVSQTGAALVITGTNFDGTTSVMLGKASLGFTDADLISNTEIDISIPGTLAPSGAVTVNTLGGHATTKGQYVGDPTISSVSLTKTSTGTTVVKISGTGLLGTNASATVTVGGHTVTLSGTQKATSLSGTVTGLVLHSTVEADVTTNIGSASKTGVKAN